MMRTLTVLVLSLSLGVRIARAEGKKVATPTAGCPTVVIMSASRDFPGAKMTACRAAKEAGSDRFEVKLTRKVGGAIGVDFASNGNVLQIEETLAINKLPDAVAKASKRSTPRRNRTAPRSRQSPTGACSSRSRSRSTARPSKRRSQRPARSSKKSSGSLHWPGVRATGVPAYEGDDPVEQGCHGDFFLYSPLRRSAEVISANTRRGRSRSTHLVRQA